MLHLRRLKFSPRLTTALVGLALVLGRPASGADTATPNSPSSPFAPSGVQPANLRCEYTQNPVGVDSIRPKLSWGFESRERNQKQSAYHILVATKPALLEANKGDLWDSRVKSSPASPSM